MPRTNNNEPHTETFYIRVDYVVKEILKKDSLMQSKRSGALAESVAKKFGCINRQAYNYIKEAKKIIRKKIREQSEKDFDKNYLKAMMDRELVIAMAKDSFDWKNALDAMKDRDKLKGLYAEEVNVNVNEVKVIKDDI